MAFDRRSTSGLNLHPMWNNLGSLDDSNDVSTAPVYAIRSAAAGTLKVTNMDGTTCTMQFTAGETRPCAVKRIWSTGTVTITAADVEIGTQG